MDNNNKLQQYRKDYYQKNREYFINYRKNYYEKNIDKLRIYTADYYEKNKDRMNQNSYEKYHADIEKYRKLGAEVSARHYNKIKDEKVECECGHTVSKISIKVHKKSNKHKSLMDKKNVV